MISMLLLLFGNCGCCLKRGRQPHGSKTFFSSLSWQYWDRAQPASALLLSGTHSPDFSCYLETLVSPSCPGLNLLFSSGRPQPPEQLRLQASVTRPGIRAFSEVTKAILKSIYPELGMVVHLFNCSSQEVEAGGSLGF